jgi:type II secretion system protein C
LAEILNRYNLKRDQLIDWGFLAAKVLAVVFISYLTAAAAMAVIAGIFSSSAITSIKASAKPPPAAASAYAYPDINYMKLEKAIVERNIFNSEGKVPDESSATAEAKSGAAKFDINAPCQRSAIEIELLGTIYLGAGPNSGSIATVMEKGYTQADSYKVGDTIVGYDDALVARIEPNRLILNNGGKKECLELAGPKLPQLAGLGDGVESVTSTTSVSAPVASGGGEVTLEAAYVEQQIGEGGGNILNQGRLVPFNQDGAMKGFKLISLKAGGIFDKIGLKNNDVITQVNDTSLQQPDQGFAFYQAFENETQIRINVLRGDQALSFTVKVK